MLSLASVVLMTVLTSYFLVNVKKDEMGIIHRFQDLPVHFFQVVQHHLIFFRIYAANLYFLVNVKKDEMEANNSRVQNILTKVAGLR